MLAKTLSDRLEKALPLAHRKVEHPPKPIALKKCLHGTIRQEDVPSDFRMPVPIVVRFDDRPPLVRRVWVEGRSVEVEIPLPAKPRDVEFNYHHSVLARVR